MTNALATQTSPYLLQHAENPVDWYPWGTQALQFAIQQDMPILLSIGYSACHWCHVMAHDCFENEVIAAQMNRLFVCIKVDREERPDLDKIYQSAHHMLTQRSGGWPLTVALTPNGHSPFFAGTYFPPEPRHGLPGFGEILEQVAAHYHTHRTQLSSHHHVFQDAFAALNPKLIPHPPLQPEQVLTQASNELAKQFDGEFGGFSNAPKFPHPTQLELLLWHGAQNENGDKSVRMLELSLHNMARGGLYDQLGGGFYRYSVDRKWCIPHFEKMLYDNAQLLTLYSNAALSSGNRFYYDIAAQTATWVVREMQLEHGGYASTIDADSDGGEGKYYVWSEAELRAVLEVDEYAILEKIYGLADKPNFEGDWHFNIHPQVDVPINDPTFQTAKNKLLIVRKQRIRPALDDKILTAWNGLMIKSMACAARALGDDQWVISASRSVDFIRANLWRDERLLVTSRAGKSHLNGYLDDYAFLAEGLVELLQVKWRSSDLAFAIKLCDAIQVLFEDPELGGFFFTSHDHEMLPYRFKAGPDDAIPSGNGAAIRVLFKLGYLLGNSAYLKSAEKAVQLFADGLHRLPSLHGSINIALQAGQANNKIVIIRGADDEITKWQTIVGRRYRPNTMIFAIPAAITDLPDALAQRTARRNTIAYVCSGFTCSPPIDSPEMIEAELV